MKSPNTAALQAALYSFALTAWTVATMMVSVGWSLGPANGGFNDWPSFVAFLGKTWFAAVIGLVFSIGPYARAKQGFTAQTNTNALPPPEQNQAPKPTGG